MNESMPGGEEPKKIQGLQQITEHAVEKAMDENTTPVLDTLIDKPDQEYIRSRFPITNDDSMAEDMARHMYFGKGHDIREREASEGLFVGAAQQVHESQIRQRMDAVSDSILEPHEKVVEESNLQKKIAQLRRDIESERETLSHMASRGELNEEKEKQKADLQENDLKSLEEELDLIEKRTMPGSLAKERALVKEIERKYHELEDIIRTARSEKKVRLN